MVASASPSSSSSYTSLAAALTLQPAPLVTAGPTPRGGRGLITHRPLPAGTTLLSVDVSCALVLADATPVPPASPAAEALADWSALHDPPPPLLASFILTSPDNWFARAVAWLMWATAHGPPVWRAYGDVLPGLDDLSSLMTFSAAEAETLLRGAPGLVAAAAAERAAIAGLHDRLFSSASGALAALDLAPSLDHTLRAAALINSRSFAEAAPPPVGWDGGGGGGGASGGASAPAAALFQALSLVVPCVDLANHDPDDPNAVFGFIGEDEGGAGGGCAAFGLRASRDLEAGEEVTISYTGDGGSGGRGGVGGGGGGGASTSKDSTRMLRDYGFVPAGNRADVLAPLGASPAEAARLGGDESPAFQAAAARAAAAAVVAACEGATSEDKAAARRAGAALTSIASAAAAPVGGGGPAAAGSGVASVSAGLPPLAAQAAALAAEADGRAGECRAAGQAGAVNPARAAAAAGWWAERAALARAVVGLLE